VVAETHGWGYAEGAWCRLRDVGRWHKFIDTILSGRSDTNITFEQTVSLLEYLGFDKRIRGSHHIFTREGIEELINIQETEGGRVKPYQVKQVCILKKYYLRMEL
jgi:predicted RNA binding protein YcfA (HicA-like mRNA interferase family)